MKKVVGIERFHWRRFSEGGVEYGPYYLYCGAVIVGSASECVGGERWITWVLPRGPNREKRTCYARTKVRAMYFVESWAKYHGER
jgi:hypothetical protein